jgi:hypothetical protein
MDIKLLIMLTLRADHITSMSKFCKTKKLPLVAKAKKGMIIKSKVIV